MNIKPLVSSKIEGPVIALITLLFVSLTFIGCGAPDRLAVKIMHEGDQLVSLFGDETVKLATLNEVSDKIEQLQHKGSPNSELKPFLDQRIAILNERARIESDIKASNKRRNRLIAQWEGEHHGQKYEDPRSF